MIHIKKMSEMMGNSEHTDEYPYGTRLDLTDDMVKELGIGDLAAGATVKIAAVGFIKKKSTEEEAGEETEQYLCIQLTELDVKQAEGRDRASLMYGGDDGE